MFLAGLEAGLQRRFQAKEGEKDRRFHVETQARDQTFQAGEGEKSRAFAGEQAEKGRAHDVGMQTRGMSQQERLAGIDALLDTERQTLGAAAQVGASGGLDPRGLMDFILSSGQALSGRAQQLYQPANNAAASGALAPNPGAQTPSAPGAAGGSPIPEARQRISGIQSTPSADDQVARARQEIESYSLSQEGRKGLVVPVKVSRVEAFGWDKLPPQELEEAALREFPQYAPKASLDPAKAEDRTGLDALMRWLREKVPVDVVSGPALAAMREQGFKKYPPGVFDKALASVYSEHGKPAMSMSQAREMAKAKLVAQMQEKKQASNAVAVQATGGSLSSLLGAFQERAQMGSLEGAPQPVTLTGDMARQLGLDVTQLPRGVGSFLSSGLYKAVPDQAGGYELAAAGGATVAPETQAAFRVLLDSVPGFRENLDAVSRGGPAKARTPAETEKLGTMNAIKSGAPEGEAPATTPPATEAPVKSPLDIYRERRKAGGAKKPTPQRASAGEAYRGASTGPGGSPSIGFYDNAGGQQKAGLLELLQALSSIR